MIGHAICVYLAGAALIVLVCGALRAEIAGAIFLAGGWPMLALLAIGAAPFVALYFLGLGVRRLVGKAFAREAET